MRDNSIYERNGFLNFTFRIYIFLNWEVNIMNELKKILLEEQYRLENMVSKLQEQLKTAPKGYLRLSKSHNHIQYYWHNEEDNRSENKYGNYISKNNLQLAYELAQKAYDKKVLELAEKRLSQIRRITKDYVENEIEQIFWNEHIERQKFIKPIEFTWKQKVDKWKEKEYKGKEFQVGTPVILTEKGERVRSKSEKIMADYFYRNGIEYKYECPLYLKGLGTVYPDFTFLSKKNGKEIYWEHNGKVDDPIYARNMVGKINAYESNGIFVGDRLILTFETEQMILNTSKIEEMANRYL